MLPVEISMLELSMSIQGIRIRQLFEASDLPFEYL